MDVPTIFGLPAHPLIVHATVVFLPRPCSTTGSAVLGVVAAIAVVGTTAQVVRIGHSGAQASWSNVANRSGR